MYRQSIFLFGILFLLLSMGLLGQNTQPSSGARKAPASPATPQAIIDTTAGKMTCSLFPAKAPIGVANFIGLAKGTKDWTSPSTGRRMHGVPLYN
ncbi:MAG: hypothetical protein JO159_10515, partial [Acidobacteria bacterium]|nr:hypothetical protein [Acidobacteriota bacterium]